MAGNKRKHDTYIGDTSIPTIDDSQSTTKNIGIIMYPSSMGTFNISTPILAISSTPGGGSPPLRLVPFRTMYLDDPWALPSSSNSDEDTILTRV